MKSTKSEISYQPLGKQQIAEVVALHLKAFEGYMNSSLGTPYLRQFYKWFLNDEGAIAIGAVDNQEKTLGFVVGAPLGYEGELNRSLFGVAAIALFSHPWLLFRKDLRATILARLRLLAGSPPSPREYPVLPDPTMSLVGIGVSPYMQKTGIGKGLISAFEQECRVLRMQSMRLSVYPDNLSARKLYESCGWQEFPSTHAPGQSIFYSKVLD